MGFFIYKFSVKYISNKTNIKHKYIIMRIHGNKLTNDHHLNFLYKIFVTKMKSFSLLETNVTD